MEIFFLLGRYTLHLAGAQYGIILKYPTLMLQLSGSDFGISKAGYNFLIQTSFYDAFDLHIIGYLKRLELK